MRKLLMTAAVAFGAAGLGVMWMQPSVQAAGTAQAAAAPAAAPLGDLAPMAAIVADTTTIAAGGDMAAAKARITDFETAWDDAAAAMRPMDPLAWGNIDAAADAALDALRAAAPDTAGVTATLAALSAALAEPIPGGAPTPAAASSAGLMALPDGTYATTDANGHNIPCEDFVAAVQAAQAASTLAPADQANADDFQAKGTERCNADDDARADAFLAQALTLLAPRT